MPCWTDGAPPDFWGYSRVLVVLELPSMFGEESSRYRYTGVFWTGTSWSSKEVYRARRWMEIPLPREEE